MRVESESANCSKVKLIKVKWRKAQIKSTPLKMQGLMEKSKISKPSLLPMSTKDDLTTTNRLLDNISKLLFLWLSELGLSFILPILPLLLMSTRSSWPTKTKWAWNFTVCQIWSIKLVSSHSRMRCQCWMQGPVVRGMKPCGTTSLLSSSISSKVQNGATYWRALARSKKLRRKKTQF